MASSKRRVIVSPAAREELAAIFAYHLEVAGSDVADRIFLRLTGRIDRLADLPFLGVALERPAGVRALMEGGYGIYYRTDGDTVRIAHVLHHRQNRDVELEDDRGA